MHPDALERCSFIDENCDTVNNEGLDCSFTAHFRDVLYEVDPFAPTVTFVADVTLPGQGGMLDIDIDNEGDVLAVLGDGLYDLESDGSLSLLANVATPPNTNGMAIDSLGQIFITNGDGGDSMAYKVDRDSGVLTVLGSLSPYQSSGDCVITKNDSLLMTSPDPQNPDVEDVLVFVNSVTGETSLIGPTGFSEVYGLSASFGFLFGVTDFGEVILLDEITGAGTLLYQDEDLRFWGAANGD